MAILAPLDAVVGFAVKQRGVGGRATTLRQCQNEHFLNHLATLDYVAIADPDCQRRFDAFACDGATARSSHMTRINSIGSQRAGFVETGGP